MALNFRVTWRHSSCDHETRSVWFPRYSEIFRPKHHFAHIDTMLNRHCACAISRDVYPICKMWAHISISHPHFAYSLCHFHWAPMKKNGCSLSGPKAKSSENFLNPTICKFWPLGALEIMGYEKSRFLLQKHHPCVNPRRLSHFAWRSVRGSAPPRVSKKNTQKVTRARLP